MKAKGIITAVLLVQYVIFCMFHYNVFSYTHQYDGFLDDFNAYEYLEVTSYEIYKDPFGSRKYICIYKFGGLREGVTISTDTDGLTQNEKTQLERKNFVIAKYMNKEVMIVYDPIALGISIITATNQKLPMWVSFMIVADLIGLLIYFSIADRVRGYIEKGRNTKA